MFPLSTLYLAILFFSLVHCGGVAFEWGDADKKRQAEPERIVVTPPDVPLKFATESQPLNVAGAKHAVGIVARFNYESKSDDRLDINIVSLVRDGCTSPNEAQPEFLWRELDAAGLAIAEEKVAPHKPFRAKGGLRYMLVVEMKASRICQTLNAAFTVSRYPVDVAGETSDKTP